MRRLYFLTVLGLSALRMLGAQSLPGSRVLTQELSPEQWSAQMVAGIDRMALRLTAELSGKASPDRRKLGEILGVVDARAASAEVAFLEAPGGGALLDCPDALVRRVRWQSLPGLWAEGLLVRPKGKVQAHWIVLPEIGVEPESLITPELLGCAAEVLILPLVDRGHAHSVNPRFSVRTDVGHREWIYRQTYLQGRHLIGLELQSIFAWVDDCQRRSGAKVWIGGQGEGGRLALMAAALDERLAGVHGEGGFGPRANLWRQPLDCNVFGLLLGHGDAQLASLVAPRSLSLSTGSGSSWKPPLEVEKGLRRIGAPGEVHPITEAEFSDELQRAVKLAPGLKVLRPAGGLVEAMRSLSSVVGTVGPEDLPRPVLAVDSSRMERLVRGMERWAQEQLDVGERQRQSDFWQALPLKDRAAHASFNDRQRARFWNEVIGRLPDPDRPAAPRSRLLRVEDGVQVHEVVLDVFAEVFAWGWLCLPADFKPGQVKPVVVCQHGLEGLPGDVMQQDRGTRAYAAYKAFALELAKRGYITFAPHNPYRGMHDFRTLQRKLNPIGLTLYSVINAQHQQILRWLSSLPMVDPKRIGFYGLSYGGKSAMRTPACLPQYSLSICSGDFNEWVRKCVSLQMPMSYVHTHEYEIWEWNLGQTFNYAEMAALIAPRPFMVERGHDDGVGRDEWVNYEYAKVRQLYDKLGLGSLCEIEHFDGPHTIHGVGSYDFLRRHLPTN